MAKPVTTIEKSYEETAKVYRLTGVENQGISSFESVLLYEDVPCGFSRWTDKWRRSGLGALGESHQSLYYGALLFLAPGWEILPGDVVEVNQLGMVTAYEVMGNPTRYPTHQEVFLAKRGLA